MKERLGFGRWGRAGQNALTPKGDSRPGGKPEGLAPRHRHDEGGGYIIGSREDHFKGPTRVLLRRGSGSYPLGARRHAV